MPSDRASGLLLHITSLPSPFGIGDLGPEARRFVEVLAGAGQRYWQMLPIGPTGEGNSPYQSPSSFAGSPLLISPELLVEDGLLEEDDLEPLSGMTIGRVDFERLSGSKPAVLEKAARALRQRGGGALDGFRAFREEHGSAWLNEFALFLALKRAHGRRLWSDWSPDLVDREPRSLAMARRELRSEIEMVELVQFLFFDQWERLRQDARDHGVDLVGDLPLYTAHDSADVWTNQEAFLLDERRMPSVVGGVPPDYFSNVGQRWGNPIYDWVEMAKNDFAWWRRRMRHAASLFEVVRIDHFRGFAGYWAIPGREATAEEGAWHNGPGEDLLDAISDELGYMPFLAEDLGLITDDVIALRKRYQLPGMRVAQFGYDTAPDAPLHQPPNYPEDVWGYTGTHDNDTTEGWFWDDNPGHERAELKRRRRRLLETVGQPVSWGLVEMVARSRARTAIYPVQDLLGLGSEARMNTPGTTYGNWEWRLGAGELADDALERLRLVTLTADRVHDAAVRNQGAP